MKVEMIALPQGMTSHVKKLNEVLAKAHMVGVAVATLNAHGGRLTRLNASCAKFEDELTRAASDSMRMGEIIALRAELVQADEQMAACVETAMEVIGDLIVDMTGMGIIDPAGAERIKSMMDCNVEKASKGAL